MPAGGRSRPEVLSGQWARAQLIRYDRIGSTNDEAKRLLSESPGPYIIIAKSQSKGRGRQARTFFSPPGGLYFSLAWKEAFLYKSLSLLPALAGLAMSRSLNELYGLETGLKWVNDIMLKNKKVGGILAESVFSEPSYSYVLGIGLNLVGRESEFPDEIKGKAGFLFEELPENFSDLALINNFINRLFYYFNENIDEGGREYELLCSCQGSKIGYKINGCLVQGLVKKINPDGSLSVLLDDGSTDVLKSGEIEQ